jgi:hypothetical protein
MMDEKTKKLSRLLNRYNQPRGTTREREIIKFLETMTESNFAMSLVSQYEKNGRLSQGQMNAAKKMRLNEDLKKAIAANPEHLKGIDLNKLKKGMYREPGAKKIWNIYQNDACKWRNERGLRWTNSEFGLLELKVLIAEGKAFRMNEEQQIELGRETGICIVCARLLADEKSVEAGIGPVCRKKLRMEVEADDVF